MDFYLSLFLLLRFLPCCSFLLCFTFSFSLAWFFAVVSFADCISFEVSFLLTTLLNVTLVESLKRMRTLFSGGQITSQNIRTLMFLYQGLKNSRIQGLNDSRTPLLLFFARFDWFFLIIFGFFIGFCWRYLTTPESDIHEIH